jgi:hypothetical protein
MSIRVSAASRHHGGSQNYSYLTARGDQWPRDSTERPVTVGTNRLVGRDRGTDRPERARGSGGAAAPAGTQVDLHAGHITITTNAASFDGADGNSNDDTVTLSGATVFGNQPDN